MNNLRRKEPDMVKRDGKMRRGVKNLALRLFLQELESRLS